MDRGAHRLRVAGIVQRQAAGPPSPPESVVLAAIPAQAATLGDNHAPAVTTDQVAKYKP